MLPRVGVTESRQIQTVSLGQQGVLSPHAYALSPARLKHPSLRSLLSVATTVCEMSANIKEESMSPYYSDSQDPSPLTRPKDGKRKAEEEPSSPAATKRVKTSDSVEPEKAPALKPIPFP